MKYTRRSFSTRDIRASGKNPLNEIRRNKWLHPFGAHTPEQESPENSMRKLGKNEENRANLVTSTPRAHE